MGPCVLRPVFVICAAFTATICCACRAEYFITGANRRCANVWEGEDIKAASALGCCRICLSNSACGVVSYNPATMKCQLCDRVLEVTDEGGADEDIGDWQVYVVKVVSDPTLSTTHPVVSDPTLSTTHPVVSDRTSSTTHQVVSDTSSSSTHPVVSDPTPRTTNPVVSDRTSSTTHQGVTDPTSRTTHQVESDLSSSTTYLVVSDPTPSSTHPAESDPTPSTTHQVVTYPTLSSTYPGGCDEDWLYYNSSCYWLEPEPLTWFSAEDNCMGLGARLVEIGDQQENDFLYVTFADPAIWIGLNHIDAEGSLVLPSGAPVGYQNIAEGHEDLASERCFIMARTFGQQWRARTCGIGMYYSVCEKAVFW